MKTIFSTAVVLVALFANGCALGQINPLSRTWSATIIVQDEDSAPVPGAKVGVYYTIDPRPGQNWEYGRPAEVIEGKTDELGVFRASHTDDSPSLAIRISKDEYYQGRAGQELSFPGTVDAAKLAVNLNPTFNVVLKKIVKPIPMYARRIEGGPPIFNKSTGYDLVAGDWVAPYGKGQTTDIIFTGNLDQRAKDDLDYKLTISFPNVGDGIQEFNGPPILSAREASDLRSTHEAPSDYYQPEWIQTEKRRPHTPTEVNRDGNRNFFIRVRTILDENGKIRSALYGKIYGDFMQFTYYLNPTPNDRNIEFDPNQNLLPNQHVTAP